MALSAPDRLTVFEIFDVPPVVTAVEMWGNLGSDQAVEQYAFTSPVAAIDGRIAALTADMETRVRELLVEWRVVATSELRLDKADEIEGQVRDAAQKRRLILHRLQVYIPVFLEGELESRYRERQGGGGNRILRG